MARRKSFMSLSRIPFVGITGNVHDQPLVAVGRWSGSGGTRRRCRKRLCSRCHGSSSPGPGSASASSMAVEGRVRASAFPAPRTLAPSPYEATLAIAAGGYSIDRTIAIGCDLVKVVGFEQTMASKAMLPARQIELRLPPGATVNGVGARSENPLALGSLRIPMCVPGVELLGGGKPATWAPALASLGVVPLQLAGGGRAVSGGQGALAAQVTGEGQVHHRTELRQVVLDGGAGEGAPPPGGRAAPAPANTPRGGHPKWW